VAGIGVVAALGVWAWNPWASSPAGTTVPPPAAKSVDPATPAAAGAPGALQSLCGSWRRPDGGYVIEVRSAAPDGRLDAGYFNPNPIRVSKAEASQAGRNLRVLLELSDVNYPGSTYTLFLSPGNDRLEGTYYQAAIQQSFEVTFDRITP
jgi:hypothetical protein